MNSEKKHIHEYIKILLLSIQINPRQITIISITMNHLKSEMIIVQNISYAEYSFENSINARTNLNFYLITVYLPYNTTQAIRDDKNFRKPIKSIVFQKRYGPIQNCRETSIPNGGQTRQICREERGRETGGKRSERGEGSVEALEGEGESGRHVRTIRRH